MRIINHVTHEFSNRYLHRLPDGTIRLAQKAVLLSFVDESAWESINSLVGGNRFIFRFGGESLSPANLSGHLHDDEQCHDRTDGNGETGETLQEKRIRESHQVDELSQRCLARSELESDNQTQIANYEKH